MFDLRYHVASLAAVFLALVIGILVGVGISGNVSSGEKSLEKKRISALEKELQSTRQNAAEAARQQRALQQFVQETYPVVMHNRLKGKRIALVFVGSVDGHVRSIVQQALQDASAARAVRIRALKVPIDPQALDGVLVARPALARYAGDRRLSDLGRALGEEFVSGGDTPLWDALSGQLVEERAGGTAKPVDGVVVVHSADPQEGVTAQFLEGLYSGLAGSAAAAVGVELSKAKVSAVPAFSRSGLSTVDDLDTAWGRLALALLLAGSERGNYGLKQTADAVLPPIVRPAPAIG